MKAAPTTILPNGTKVRTNETLESTAGMVVFAGSLSAMRPNAPGVIQGVVPGHGGDATEFAARLTFRLADTVDCDACGQGKARRRDGFCSGCGAGDGAREDHYVSYQIADSSWLSRPARPREVVDEPEAPREECAQEAFSPVLMAGPVIQKPKRQRKGG